jgi:hypothetical protein
VFVGMGKKADLIGQRFGRLLVIQNHKRKNRLCRICICNCGNIKSIRSTHLLKGITKSCGCLAKEIRTQKNIESRKYHPIISSARMIWKRRYKDGIKFDDFLILSQKECYYCGTPPFTKHIEVKKGSPEYVLKYGTFIYNGLDRLDSNKNHSKNNVVPCCKYCNYAKNNRSYYEYVDWVKKIYDNLKNRGVISEDQA